LPGLLTGRQCLEVYAAAKGLAAIDADVLELAEAFTFTGMLDRFVAAYSLGTKQKLAVLLALLGDPVLVVLDEAFNGLDPASALVLKRHRRARVGRAMRCTARHACARCRGALLGSRCTASRWPRRKGVEPRAAGGAQGHAG